MLFENPEWSTGEPWWWVSLPCLVFKMMEIGVYDVTDLCVSGAAPWYSETKTQFLEGIKFITLTGLVTRYISVTVSYELQ